MTRLTLPLIGCEEFWDLAPSLKEWPSAEFRVSIRGVVWSPQAPGEQEGCLPALCGWDKKSMNLWESWRRWCDVGQVVSSRLMLHLCDLFFFFFGTWQEGVPESEMVRTVWFCCLCKILYKSTVGWTSDFTRTGIPFFPAGEMFFLVLSPVGMTVEASLPLYTIVTEYYSCRLRLNQGL